MIIPVKTTCGSYNIFIEKNGLSKANEYFNLNRKVLIVTDSGVPKKYSETVASLCKEPYILTVPQGESSKCLDRFAEILTVLTENEFSRTDCVVAVGGGVVGDLAGFASSAYMRGIDFYNIPTTVLSQVDSSIGGKTAIDFKGYKNIVGAFHQPKGVLIDIETLSTLPPRQISNGLAESVKMSLTSDPELFRLLESSSPRDNMETIIEKSLRIKKSVVEKDEKESGLRKILNFGHTLAHAIESEYNLEEFYHGECVAMGMTRMCDEKVRERLIPVLEKLNLPTEFSVNKDKILDSMRHDKKVAGDKITIIYVPEVGKYEIREIPLDELSNLL